MSPGEAEAVQRPWEDSEVVGACLLARLQPVPTLILAGTKDALVEASARNMAVRVQVTPRLPADTVLVLTFGRLGG